MQSSIDLRGTEELERPEIAVRIWPKSIDFEQLGNAGRIALLCTKGTEIDPHATLFSLLTVAGGVIGPSVYLYIGETRHYCRLYTVLVGKSSRGRKGSSAGPINSVFDELLMDFGSIKTSGPLSSGEGLLWRIRDESGEVDKDGNSTDPGVDDKRLIVQDGEFAAALRAMKRETNTLSAILRSAWDDGNISPLTKTKPVKVSNGHIVFVSHITSDELSACLSETDALNGFANRILWVCTQRQGSVPFPPRISSAARGEIIEILRNTLEVASRTSEMTMHDDERAVYARAYPILTQDRPGLFGAATSRAEALVMRLSMILALIEGSPIIRTLDLIRALDVWRYAEESARFIFGDREPDQRANKILKFLESGEKKQSEITRELFQKNEGGIADVLEYLQAVGKIESRTEKTGRRPITWWKISTKYTNDKNDINDKMGIMS